MQHLQWVNRARLMLQSSLQACGLAWGGSRYPLSHGVPLGELNRWKNAQVLRATAALPAPIAVRLTKQRNIGCGSSVERAQIPD